MIRSDLAGFYRLPMVRRRQKIAEITGLSDEEQRILSGEEGLCAEQANHMVENALGITGLPLGVCVNMVLNGRDRLIPMAIEEASVVAAASHASKLLRRGGGVVAEVSPSVMISQVQLLDVPDLDQAEAAIAAAEPELLKAADSCDPCLLRYGGGARQVQVRRLMPLPDDPLGPMLVVHLLVDVRDAMGANTVNTMAEFLAPTLEKLSGGRSRLRIVSNLAAERTVTVRGRVPFAALEGKGCPTGEDLARGIEEASVFAERDPYRAATHNKGVMNGVDAVLIAFGQDWRAVEAGAHAYAAREGRYTALARWRVNLDAQVLEGEMVLPMPVGTVGGITTVHPTVQAARRLAAVEGAADLAALTAAVGLAQNFGALRALAAEGIQKGHMRVHARNVATSAGAVGPEVEKVAQIIADRGKVCAAAASRALKHVRSEPATNIPVADMHGRFQVLRETHLPRVLELIDQVLGEVHPDGSPLAEMCSYQIGTGGKRVRAILPLLVAESLGVDPACLTPFGAACEVLHNATIIHDDLQDREATRRGQPAVWSRYGTPQAVNLGDAMLYYSLLLIDQLDVTPARRQLVARRAMRETLRVLDGHEREFELCRTATPTLDDYFAMIRRKTSGLFALPMAGAAALCGTPRPVVEGLQEAAHHVGVLFQVQDDLFELCGGDCSELRPSRLGAVRHNVLLVHALERAPEPHAATVRRLLDGTGGRRRHSGSVSDLVDLFARTGSVAFAVEEIERCRRAAINVKALADHPRLLSLVETMCDVLLEPVREVAEKYRDRGRSRAV